ncbi:MAG: UvrABC system protein A [Candidatus Magasanikbacteria bacterium GW2011_GWC2_40_17]|uniref:UvrABC system protein A n=1 Tax=Candidatus Magasanikbacteria bacterium GW2011_GWA2_42_32 TaxID=1619039 RepID=A0A0G1A8C2_9BACT|nr:MAG: UvrABC system protein A [Candidatus Magasanikbacteria bacterium GW2011_GWC2_40_17]KKS57280.1 MAG: UvrABC system protein A [Candidatus Magasanikbacteria bacterium GW2011_GWA2_42_32]OGH86168.1 MAG: excinuclease ABC subunit A [Candidatus Magasanikbacteria bacterium RIFOXYB2_FULL_38_10]
MPSEKLIIRGARVNNLKNVNLEIPKNKLVVITGLSGSGKSSLAFDTIYAEGQRRYAESLSAYARQFMEMQDKPDVDEIKGLSPTIAIDQRSTTQNPRSTVGTVTEIYDHLRLLFARVGVVICPDCSLEAQKNSPGQIVEKIRQLVNDERTIKIMAPFARMEKKNLQEVHSLIEAKEIKNLRFKGKYFTAEDFLFQVKEQTISNLDVILGEVNLVNSYDIMRLVELALELGNGLIIIAWSKNSKDEELLSTHWRCPNCGRRFSDLEPNHFSFNSPQGACPKCTGLGITLEADPELIIPNPRLTLAEGAIKPWVRITGNQNWYLKLLKAVADKQDFSMDKPVGELNKKFVNLILEGTGKEKYKIENKEVEFEGVVNDLERRHRETDSDYVRKEIEEYMREKKCSLCLGRRLKEESLAVKLFGKNISEITSLPLGDVQIFFGELEKTIGDKGKLKIDRNPVEPQIVIPVLKEMSKRLDDLIKVGLDYITLDRSMVSLSGGEGQRVRLSTQLATGLTGVIYILDEPSIGLHPRDLEKLIATLEALRDLGNSVIVVEHDATMMEKADYVIDVGPGAGAYGGQIVAEGTPMQIKKDKKSLTGAYLSGRVQIAHAASARKGSGKFITIQKAKGFNLKNVDAKIPLGKLVCVTGVSGSGKSTLVIETLGKALSAHFYRSKDLPAPHKTITGLDNIDKVIMIDQSPIGRTPRSNPATYTNVFTFIRDLFTEIPEAKMRGYDAGKFSFNVKGGGRCEACAGEGYVRIPMQFLTDVFVLCPECQGKRYTADVLEIHYQGKNIVDVLNMPVLEARQFFRNIPAIADKLQILVDVGLGYLQLGQPATKLSGGEAQRVKLATELSRRATGKTFYILDEPTTGLHFEDIKQLLNVLNQLVDKGNTVLIIEHNLDVINNSDWVIDLGPEGGRRGGEIVAEGVPKDVMKIKKSYTGQYLKKNE